MSENRTTDTDKYAIGDRLGRSVRRAGGIDFATEAAAAHED